MSWQNFGTSVAAGAIAVGTWLLTTQVLGGMVETQPLVAAVIRIVISLLFLGLYVYVIDKAFPQYFCASQVAVPQEPPTQSGPAPAAASPAAPPTAAALPAPTTDTTTKSENPSGTPTKT